MSCLVSHRIILSLFSSALLCDLIQSISLSPVCSTPLQKQIALNITFFFLLMYKHLSGLVETNVKLALLTVPAPGLEECVCQILSASV